MSLTERGFRVTFTKPMNREQLANPANYEFDRFRFLSSTKFAAPPGSPRPSGWWHATQNSLYTFSPAATSTGPA